MLRTFCRFLLRTWEDINRRLQILSWFKVNTALHLKHVKICFGRLKSVKTHTELKPVKIYLGRVKSVKTCKIYFGLLKSFETPNQLKPVKIYLSRLKSVKIRNQLKPVKNSLSYSRAFFKQYKAFECDYSRLVHVKLIKSQV